MSAPDRSSLGGKQEQASIEQQLELMEAGKVRTGEDIGVGWIDTTAESIERAKIRLTELNDLLTEAEGRSHQAGCSIGCSSIRRFDVIGAAIMAKIAPAL